MEHAKASSSGAVESAKQQDNSSSTGADDFAASTSFTGAREGYVFTTGDQGTGYYKDQPLHLRSKAAAKPRPVVLKSSSIVKGLQRKPASLPDAKKRKTDADVGAAKPTYLREMERYEAMKCSSNTQHDRPLVK